MHGETYRLLCEGITGWGLSPHARGNLVDPVVGLGGCGTIPACTGKPKNSAGVAGRIKDYPRMHGETRHKKPVEGAVQGLSPHARGNHSDFRCH